MNNTKELKTGRRKTSVAQVELLKGKGVITVNAKSLDEYFGNHARCKAAVKAPLVVTNLEKEYDVNAKVIGGGVSSQAGALRHAIARSLAAISEESRLSYPRSPYGGKKETRSARRPQTLPVLQTLIVGWNIAGDVLQNPARWSGVFVCLVSRGIVPYLRKPRVLQNPVRGRAPRPGRPCPPARCGEPFF